MLKQLFNHCGISADVKNLEEDFPENYYPIPNNYIVFQVGSEKPSQIYSRYFEVIGQIGKLLSKNNITVVQAGDSSDPLVPNSLDLRSKLTARQLAFLIKNSRLCVTSHSFATKLCRIYKVPSVVVGSNFPKNSVVQNIQDCTYVEPELNGKKWSYRPKDDYFINSIKPEKISEAILNHLDIESRSLPNSVFIGNSYGIEVFDYVPDGQFPQHLIGKQINLRLDLYFNREALQIANFAKINIVTKDSFDLDGINIQNAISINYFCDKSADTEFVKKCKSLGLNIVVICSNEETIKDIRFNLLGITEVYKRKFENFLDKLDICATMFRSSRLVFGRNKVYPTIYHYKKDIPCDLMASKLEVVDEDVLEFSDFLYLFKTP